MDINEANREAIGDEGIGEEEVIEDATSEENLQVPLSKYSITSYGVDYPVDGLVTRVRSGSVFIPPFQRNYRWNLASASLFIESLLVGLPVPAVFFYKEPDGRLLVIDGQQRLKSLEFFYREIFGPTGKEFRLDGLDSTYNGLRYSDLTDEDKRNLNDSVIHAIIIKQDQPSEDNSSIYHIFYRLNTGGKQLNPQEVRTCISYGDFVLLLRKLNEYPSWRALFGKTDLQMRDQELILRFLSLYFWRPDYKKPMKKFLNHCLGINRNLSIRDANECTLVFCRVCDLIQTSLGKAAFRPTGIIVAGVLDSVMYGTARRLEAGDIASGAAYADAYRALLRNDEYLDACRRGTSDEAAVAKRLDLATTAFENVA